MLQIIIIIILINSLLFGNGACFYHSGGASVQSQAKRVLLTRHTTDCDADGTFLHPNHPSLFSGPQERRRRRSEEEEEEEVDPHGAPRVGKGFQPGDIITLELAE